MDRNPQVAQSEGSKGFFKGISESVRAHLDERLRSPFAGAFVVAWLAVNWQPVLVLLFSRTRIEDRIEVVLRDHLSSYSAIWHPLWLAIIIAVAFYLASSLFVVLAELYALVRNRIERGFDSFRWVSPTAYMAVKSKYNERVRYLQDLASDNLKAVEDEKERANKISSDLLEVQARLSDATAEIGRKDSAFSELSEENRELLSLVNLNQAEASDAARNIDRVSKEVASIADEIFYLRTALSTTNTPTHPPVWNRFLILSNKVDELAKMLNLDMGAGSESTLPISLASLSKYLKEQYPDLPINSQLLSRVFSDMQSAGLTKSIPTIKDVHQVIVSALPAVVEYQKTKPELFSSSVDHLSKSLGFVVPSFRSKHGFGKETKQAFIDFEHLVHT